MAATSSDAIFDQIINDWVNITRNAAKNAANKAQEDIRKKADKFIKEYYAYPPKIYTDAKRQHALYKLVEDFYSESSTGSGIKIEFGVTYNPGNIAGLHKSNSRYHQGGSKWVSVRSPKGMSYNIPTLSDVIGSGSNNGIPEPEWITNQFIEGIHPWSGKDDMSPDAKMQQFFDDELDSLVNGYISTALMDAISKYF